MDKSAIIIDDEPHVRKIMETLLASLKVNVVAEATSGEEGFELVKQHKPQLVFLDINLPKMSGIEVLKLIKKEMPSTQVVILSSVNSRTQIEELIESGADHYIIKDSSPAEIKKILSNVLEALA